MEVDSVRQQFQESSQMNEPGGGEGGEGERRKREVEREDL